MAYQAVIYVRASLESQGEKIQPCRAGSGLPAPGSRKRVIVARVDWDVEKYRAKNKLVESLGSRSGRPGLLAIIKEVSKGKSKENSPA